MPDLYTEQKLAIQPQFAVGTLADYSGQRKALHGTVKVVGHERKGGVYIESDGVRALVSPNTLTAVATLRPPAVGKRPDPPQTTNGHRPSRLRIERRRAVPTSMPTRATAAPVPAKLFRNGEPVPTPADRLLDRLRKIGQPPVAPTSAAPTPPPPPSLSAPLGRQNVEKFFHTWLRDFRRDTTHAMRQSVIDGFDDLPAYLRDRLPPEPGLHYYRQCVYYVTAVQLADPSRLPPAAEIPALISARFRVNPDAVVIHLRWMRARLAADHAAFAAKLQQPATSGVTS